MARNTKCLVVSTANHYVSAAIATVAVFAIAGCVSLPDPVTLPEPAKISDPPRPIQRHWDCPMSLNNTSPGYVDEVQRLVMTNLQIPPDTPDNALSVYGLRIDASGNLFKATLIGGTGNKEFDNAVANALRTSQYPPVPNITYEGVIEAASIAFSANRTVSRVDQTLPARRFPYVEPTVKPAPKYPRNALRSGTEGSVFAEVTISPPGDVTDVSITSAEPPHVFDQAVKDALLQFKFEKNPSEFRIEQQFKFCIGDTPLKIQAPRLNTR